MNHLCLSLTLAVAILLASALAWSTASHSVEVHRPFDQVYAAVANYFSPDSMHDFTIASQTGSKSKAEFVAQRTVQDKLKWSDWAYCAVPAMEMLYVLQQGNITVSVKMERESADHTFVTVMAEFTGVYQFAGKSITQKCVSNGVLEKDILRGAGAADTDLH